MDVYKFWYHTFQPFMCESKGVWWKRQTRKEKWQENAVWEIRITYETQYRYVNFPRDMCFWNGVKTSMTLFLLIYYVILPWWLIYMFGKSRVLVSEKIIKKLYVKSFSLIMYIKFFALRNVVVFYTIQYFGFSYKNSL